jgi:hypothetical protein
MLQVPCPKCGNQIVSNDGVRFPPWCVRCGADVKVGPEALKAATQVPLPPPVPEPSLLTASLLPRTPKLPDAAPASRHDQPPHFHARASSLQGRLYRVYCFDDELVFLDRTPWRRPSSGMLAVAFAGALGGLIFDLATRGAKQRAEHRLKAMDRAGAEELRLIADEDANSFRVRPADVSDARFEPPTAWQAWGLFTGRCAGVLAFRHCHVGDMTLELPELQDMRRALQHLPPLLGDQVTVNAVWDKTRQGYVRPEDKAQSPSAAG